LMKHFGRGFEPDQDAFVGLEIRVSEYGPYLKDALAGIGCEITGQLEAGDHRLYLCQVKEAVIFRDDSPYVHMRKSGLHY